MGRRKLTNEQIIKIANTYANDGDVVTVAYISSKYNVSSTTISNALHYAIYNCLVNETVAHLIAEKAIRHDNTRKELFGYAQNNKVAKLYADLIRSHKQKIEGTSKLVSLDEEYIELKNNLDTYDDTFSSSDEYPYTKEELEDRINSIEEQIKRNKGQI